MRVLLVEDDSMIGEAISIARRDAAYAVDWVQDVYRLGLSGHGFATQAALRKAWA